MLQFLRKRIQEIIGIALLLFGVSLGLAFVSYHPGDASFHTASDAPVQNWLGSFGSYLVSIFIPFIGVATVAIACLCSVWGLKALGHHSIRPLWLRFSSTALLVIAFSIALAFLKDDTYEQIPLGGVIGDFTLERLLGLLPYYAVLAGVIVLSLFSGYLALGVSWQSWVNGFHRVWTVLTYIGAVIVAGCMRVYYFVQRKKMPMPEKEKKAPRKKVVSKKTAPRVSKPEQTAMDLAGPDNFQPPSLALLSPPEQQGSRTDLTENALEQNAQLLEKVLEDFGVQGEIVAVRPGPVVTLYELEPAAGTKSSRVIGLADDIARSMSAVSARIAVIPGKNLIGIELPNSRRETVYLREILESDPYINSKASLAMALGKDISGDPVIADMAKMPHLLIAGTTGSGKSVGVNAMILSLLYKYRPDECKFIMIDPKMLELSVYDGIPHLLSPVVTEPNKAVVALKWVVKEMEHRYRLMANLNVRNVKNYNQTITKARAKGEKLTRTVQTGFDPDSGRPIFEEVELEMKALPFIVVIIDEMADLMLVAGKEIEASVQRLAQMARAAGIHIITATQRPSVDVITGVIKANFPTRISFQVTSKIDSRTILGEQGAEQLLGMGDMLFMEGGGRLLRVHGPFVGDDEVEKVVRHLKTQGEPEYIDNITIDESDPGFGAGGGEKDELFDQAVAVVIQENKASTSFVQRALRIGYNRAANIIDQMEADGIISAANHVGKREVLARRQDD